MDWHKGCEKPYNNRYVCGLVERVFFLRCKFVSALPLMDWQSVLRQFQALKVNKVYVSSSESRIQFPVFHSKVIDKK